MNRKAIVTLILLGVLAGVACDRSPEPKPSPTPPRGEDRFPAHEASIKEYLKDNHQSQPWYPRIREVVVAGDTVNLVTDLTGDDDEFSLAACEAVASRIYEPEGQLKEIRVVDRQSKILVERTGKEGACQEVPAG